MAWAASHVLFLAFELTFTITAEQTSGGGRVYVVEGFISTVQRLTISSGTSGTNPVCLVCDVDSLIQIGDIKLEGWYYVSEK